jgi:predicted lipoprotein with Yx(FWY)xxD motif
MRSKRTGRRIVATALAFTIVLVACGGDDDDDETGGASATTTTSAATSPSSNGQASGDQAANIETAETSLGPTLVDGQGKTIYLFENDTEPDASTCAGGCAASWPPVTVDGSLVLGEGLDESAFTTFTRDDGTTQVSVDGHPLYTYGADAAPGDTNGQGVGGVWYAVGADGKKIDTDEATPSDLGY